jgi:hypothetical protein
MAQVARGKIYVLAEELKEMGVEVLVSKTKSQYHVTVLTKSGAVTFSGIAWEIEKLIGAFKLGYALGWRARGDRDAARSGCEGNARDS